MKNYKNIYEIIYFFMIFLNVFSIMVIDSFFNRLVLIRFLLYILFLHHHVTLVV